MSKHGNVVAMVAYSWETSYEFLKETLSNSSSNLLVISVLIAILLAFYFLSSHAKWKPTKGDLVLLLGQCGSGKTAIFLQLRNGHIRETVSSLIENKDGIKLLETESKPVEVVDYPGHLRLQYGIYNLIPKSRCIIYLVDATDKSSIKPTAEHLYDLFTSSQLRAQPLPFLLACNKSDLHSARPPSLIKEDLEREIEKVRISRSALLEGQERSDIYLQADGLPFAFHSAPCPLEICQCSAKSGDVSSIISFIRKCF
ncbi:signal recognition particle receptor beta subunit protein [Cardiosporidium cionae]|uniref:Signal recognition particle receptor subunit beta n=1 Tax=Cardiosporidium cionae TaxID=476202 RepID=A0ABQ7JC98_9APIC|nr:signal recognition particle receptor beta subunit protein [Cardiosporidium cionae]|eukprot:KAF8821568.1 signal recognition particle receptor beta subunit protein [Cardiosporidium cionae]